MEYQEYLAHQNKIANVKERIAVGEHVFFYSEYNITLGKVIKMNTKKAKLLIDTMNPRLESISYDRIVKKGDKVAFIWELWKGVNGRGGYRWERENYLEALQPVETIIRQTYLYEEALGAATLHKIQNYRDTQKQRNPKGQDLYQNLRDLLDQIHTSGQYKL